MKKRIAVVGAMGRTGKHVVEALRAHESAVLHAAVVSERSSKLGLRVDDTDASYSDDLGAIAGADIVIEFTTPDVSMEVARRCAEHGIPVVVATTGHTTDQLRELEMLSGRIPLARVSNTSLGATALGLLAKQAQQLLGSGFDIEVLEIHHRRKKDAPSGTACTLAEGLVSPDMIIAGRDQLRQPDEIGVASLRGGDVAGDHTVYFLGAGERIEMTHRVSSRRIFGTGAVAMGLRLSERPNGMYVASDLMG